MLQRICKKIQQNELTNNSQTEIMTTIRSLLQSCPLSFALCHFFSSWDFFKLGLFNKETDSDLEQVWRLTRALCHFLAFGDNEWEPPW